MNASPPEADAGRLQRVEGGGRIAVRRRAGTTRLETLYQEGAAKIRLPRGDGAPLEAVLINTAGGLTGGDRLAWSVEVGPGAAAVVTTQACERIYRAPAGMARATCRISVGAGGRVAWLPQETIVFDRSAFRRDIEAELEEGAELLLVEATIFGRTAMGETVTSATFRDRWRVRRSGRLVHAEDFAIGPDVGAMLAHRAATGGGVAMATLLLVADDATERLDALRSAVGGLAASAWRVGPTGKLLARIVARDSYALRESLMPAIEMLNGKAGLPKAWSL